MDSQISNKEYQDFLVSVKSQIKSSQAKAALAVNSSLIGMYWNIGEMIAKNQALFEGRNNYIDQLAKDIQSEFPGISGFSKRNLFDIRRFYLFYSSGSVRQPVALNPIGTELSIQQPVGLEESDSSSVQQLVALNQTEQKISQVLSQVPWGHHLLILNKVKNAEAASFYLQQIVENNWSRAVLTLHIE